MVELNFDQMAPLSSGLVLCTHVTLDSVLKEAESACARQMRPGLALLLLVFVSMNQVWYK